MDTSDGVVAGAVWDLVVLDEGHKIKNKSTAIAKAVRALPSSYRLLLTGTPLQNNLEELWSLFDYVTAGALLGTIQSFKRRFGDSITRARDRQAMAQQREEGAAAAARLSALIRPHMLRREKLHLMSLPGAPDRDGSTQHQEPRAGLSVTANSNGDLPAGNSVSAESAHSDDTGGLAASFGLLSLAAANRPASGAEAQSTAARNMLGTLGLKKEVVLWTKLSPVQIDLTTAFLASRTVATALTTDKKCILSAITILQKIASHPVLLSEKWRRDVLQAAVSKTGAGAGTDNTDDSGSRSGTSDESSSEDDTADDELRDDGAAATASSSVEAEWDPVFLPPAQTLVEQSGKLACFAALMRDLLPPPPQYQQDSDASSAADTAVNTSPPSDSHHRVLVFSKSKCILDVLERVLRSLYTLRLRVTDGTSDVPLAANGVRGVPFLRIDGDVDAKQRRGLVERFNNCSRANDASAPRVCLLTTGVGALGLTLTGADRVVIFDVSWNPAVDAQAVDRAYRVGQTRDVVTYRLISCGTVEETMYRLQVFKGGLTTSVIGGGSAGQQPEERGRDRSKARGGARAIDPPPSAFTSQKWAARLLTRSELKQLFSLGCTTRSETQALVDAQLEPPPPVPSAYIGTHLLGLTTGDIGATTAGWSHHDHLFRLRTETIANPAAGESGDSSSDRAQRLLVPGGLTVPPSQAQPVRVPVVRGQMPPPAHTQTHTESGGVRATATATTQADAGGPAVPRYKRLVTPHHGRQDRRSSVESTGSTGVVGVPPRTSGQAIKVIESPGDPQPLDGHTPSPSTYNPRSARVSSSAGAPKQAGLSLSTNDVRLTFPPSNHQPTQPPAPQPRRKSSPLRGPYEFYGPGADSSVLASSISAEDNDASYALANALQEEYDYIACNVPSSVAADGDNTAALDTSYAATVPSASLNEVSSVTPATGRVNATLQPHSGEEAVGTLVQALQALDMGAAAGSGGSARRSSVATGPPLSPPRNDTKSTPAVEPATALGSAPAGTPSRDRHMRRLRVALATLEENERTASPKQIEKLQLEIMEAAEALEWLPSDTDTLVSNSATATE